MNDIFVMSRVLDSIRSPEDWSRSSGYAIADCVLGVAKELIDNSLDACEEGRMAPEITVTVDAEGVTVTDNGPGISPETVARFADLATRQSARAYRIGPTRGQQGNGTQTALVLPFVIDGQCGRAEIISRGCRHELTLTLDRLAEEPKFAVNTTEVVQSGTFVRLYLPSDKYISDDSEKARFVQLVATFAWLNPHLRLVVTCFGERREFPATDPEWKKWTPGGYGPPQWYTEEDFTRLTMETIRHDPTRRISDYIAEFAGLRRPPVRAGVLETTGLARQSMSALANGQVARLYTALLEHGKAVQPDKLGVIGRARLKARMEADCDMSTFRHDCVADIDEDGRPFVVEMALAESDEARVIRGVNWSAMIGDPFPMLDESQHYIYGDVGVTLFVQYIKPGATSMDRGKTRVSVSEKVKAVMEDMLAKLAENWVHKCKAAIRKRDSADRQSMIEEKKQAAESQRDNRRSLKDLVYQVLPSEIENYRATLGSPIWERQLYYNVRNAVKKIDRSKKFDQAQFGAILRQFQRDFGEVDDLANKPRGTFIEPHTGRKLPLGTLEVAQYVIPEYEYHAILLVEKAGFAEVFASHKIAQKYDIGLIFNEGQSVKACKELVSRCARKGIKVFVLHDTDPAGYVIFDVMRAEVEQLGAEVVDISWTVDECLALGKEPESDHRRCAKASDEWHGLPQRIIPLLSPAARKLFLGKKIINPGIKFKRRTPFVWEYHRIELNDIFTDPEYAMGKIEKRLKAHGCKKLVPPRKHITRQAGLRRQNIVTSHVAACLSEMIGMDAMVDAVAKAMIPNVAIKNIPDAVNKWAAKPKPESWTECVDHVIEARADAIGDQIQRAAKDILRRTLLTPKTDMEAGDND
jgi:hypothetical protein